MPSEQSAAVSQTRPYIGGQAVLEGVMMRSPSSFAVAVRRADGSISIRERPMTKKQGGFSWAKVPFARGVATLVESLKLGSEALRFSAELMEKDIEAGERAADELEKARKSKSTGVGAILNALGLSLMHMFTRAEGDEVEIVEEKRSSAPMAIMTIVAVVFLVALPPLCAWGASTLFGLHLEVQSARFQVLTGFFKLVVVLGYLLLIRRVAEIRRVFQYHGAEHKTISTYEANEDLVVGNAKKKTTLHPRCGTTFLILTVLMSIVVWTAIGPLMPKFDGPGWLKQIVFFAIKIPFLPVLAGVTFELQRLTARYCLTGPLRALLWPGFLVQKITTIEPDEDQLEIALAAMRATIWREQVGVETAPPKDAAEVIEFPSYDALVQAKGLRAA